MAAVIAKAESLPDLRPKLFYVLVGVCGALLLLNGLFPELIGGSGSGKER
jgi:hypothetical protein